MKYFTNLLVIALCVLTSISTKANNLPAEEAGNAFANFSYTIHVGAFDKAQISDFDDIRSVGYVYGYQLEDNLMQIFLGGYDSKNAARKALPKVKSFGYPDAYIMRRVFDEGETMATVQLAVKRANANLDYGKYLQAGKIYIVQVNDQLQVLAGTFESTEVAKRRAIQLQRMGFVDAKVTTINSVQLIKVTDFETGGAVANEIIAVVDTPKGGEEKAEPLPESYDVLFKKSKDSAKGGTTIPDDVPTAYEASSKRIAVPTKKETAANLPKIRVRVKRTSAIELQKILKAEGVYKSSLDGYYGKGTAKAYADIKQQNYQLKKYLMLSKMIETGEMSNLKLSRLQNIINNLLEDSSTAASLLKAERSSLAKVYRAYILFQTAGAQAEVNRLMNAAIQQTFKGKKLKNTPPDDYTSRYAYKNLEQLLKHLNYIHAASDDAEVPCWIFSQHTVEAANAFAAGRENVRMQNCGGDFMSWEETKLLKAIAADLDPAFGLDKEKSTTYSSQRALLFTAPKKLNTDETKAALAWHKSIWMAMDNWANTDPVHDQRVTALKVAYFQSQVRVEDYFMDKGFTYKQAKPLAMKVLQTIVGSHFENYLNN